VARKVTHILATWSRDLTRETTLLTDLRSIVTDPLSPSSAARFRSLSSAYGQLGVAEADKVMGPLHALLPRC
jgi:hypothetical protein